MTILRFTHVHLKNWRNFTKAEVDLKPQTFLVGPNASGKSNFLDVFRFLQDLVSPGGGFQEAVRKRGGVRRLRCLAARHDSDLAILVHIGGKENTSEWEYELHFNQENSPRPMVKRERIVRLGNDVFVRPDESDEADPERLAETHLEQVSARKDFREAADFLRSVRYLNVAPPLVREPDRSVGRRNDPFGGDLLERIALTPEKTRTARLRHILDALRSAVPQLDQLEMRRDRHGRPHLRARYGHWRSQGAWQAEDQLSDGTLRMIGMLWAALDGAGPLLLEEPEISLHPEVAGMVPAMLARLQRRSKCQVILSTHSAALLRDAGAGVDDVLLLQPGEEGTAVRPALSVEEVRTLLEKGSAAGVTRTEEPGPEDDHQLGLF